MLKLTVFVMRAELDHQRVNKVEGVMLVVVVVKKKKKQTMDDVEGMEVAIGFKTG